ncbi:MAG: efflux RND transporter periplasmic adaptor subunit [Phycisphaerales bacterium]|nr:MAG: efflux RND transporter periplasmic adaptor subunit [Phycisphaerales bacterium]
MTQTTSSPVPSTTLKARRMVVPEARTTDRSTKKSVLFALGVIATMLVVVGAAWFSWGWARTTQEVAGADKFTVVPQSFNVVLKEKGELKAANSTDIKCEVEGRSTIISLIEEGTAVQEGDLLVELASDQIEDRIQEEELKEANAVMAYEAAKTELEIQRDKNASDIRKGELEIELKSLELEKYQKGEWAQKLKDAEIAIEEAQIGLERREEDYAAAKELLGRGFITQTEYEEDEFKWQKAKWELEKARQAMTVLKDYTHVADLRRRQSDLDEATKEFQRIKKNAEAEEDKKARVLEGKEKELELTRSQLAKLRVQKEKCRILAPTPGFVVYYSEHWRWGSDNQIKEGAEVHERQILMQLPDTSEMIAAVRVHEAKTDKLQLGQSATVTIEGMPGRQFTGEVTKIAVVADTQNRWLNPDLKEYETEITLDATDVPLKPGGTAHVEILVESIENSLAVPVQTIFAKAGHRYVFFEQHDEISYKEVQLGAVGTVWAEIADGLQGGDRILRLFSDEHKQLIPDAPRGKRKPPDARGAIAPGDRGSKTPTPDSAPGRRTTRRTPTNQ